MELTRWQQVVDLVWHARRRAVDLRILWPTCKATAFARGLGLDEAKAAFGFHVFNDTAWTTRFSHGELIDFVGDLE